MYVSAFVLLVTLISLGYQAPQESTNATVADSASIISGDSPITADDVVAANVAATVAQSTSLPVAANVAELSISTQIKSEFPQSSDSSSISKPTIVELSSASRAITTYTVKSGDSLALVAKEHGISENTIKWENDLTGTSLTVGTVLRILPETGITYIVESGDTIKSIADKYKADASRITVYNDLDTSSIKPGLKIIIPNGVLPTEEQPGYVSPVQATTFITGYSSGFGGGDTWYIRTGTPNRGAYAYGNCTAYTFDRRAELGRPVGRNWGDAGSWAWYGQQAGYRVDRTPSAGAVIQDAGHVGIVEEVLPNGDLRISEMNAYVAGGGWNIVSGRTLPAANVSQYLYIH